MWGEKLTWTEKLGKEMERRLGPQRDYFLSSVPSLMEFQVTFALLTEVRTQANGEGNNFNLSCIYVNRKSAYLFSEIQNKWRWKNGFTVVLKSNVIIDQRDYLVPSSNNCKTTPGVE